MSVLKLELFDGPTPPAIPAGWNAGAGYATSTGGSPISPPNTLAYTPGSNGTYYATWGTADGAGGNVIVSAYVSIFAAAGRPFRMGVTFRGSAATLSGATSTYAAWFDWNLGTAGISKVIAGADTTLGAVTPASIPATWVYLLARANATSLQLAVQRVSDGFWLGAGGGWAPAVGGGPSCLSISDATLAAASSFHGLYAVQSGSGFTGFADSWELDSIAPAVPIPTTTVVGVPFGFYPPAVY